MLQKRSRLSKRAIEEYVIGGRRLKTERFFVVYTRIPGQKAPHISVSVSKKVAKGAVLRNRLRRRAYSAIRPLLAGLPHELGALVSYTMADTKSSIEELRSEFEIAFEKAGLYKK